MIRMNRDVVAHLLREGRPLSDATERAVGKTTGAILVALGESYRRPGEWITVDDPDQGTHMVRQWLLTTARDTVARLGLEKIEVVAQCGGGRIILRNSFAENINHKGTK